MKRRLFLLTALTFVGAVMVFAQNKQGVIQAVVGTDLSKALPGDVVYMYPSFQNGSIMYKDNTFGEGKMNLYLLGEDIHFIDPKGDTLELNNQNDVKMVSIGKDMYLRFQNSYVRILESTDQVALGMRSYVFLDHSAKEGAYGVVSNTMSVTTMRSVSEGGREYYLSSLKNLPYTLKHDLFLYANEKLYMATKKNFIKLYPEKKADIEAFIKENKTNFDNAQDALALFVYLKSL